MTDLAELASAVLAGAACAVKSKPAVQAATSSEDLQKTLWATADKLRTSASRMQIELTSEALATPALCSRHSRKGGNSAALSEYLDISGKPHQPKAEALLKDAL